MCYETRYWCEHDRVMLADAEVGEALCLPAATGSDRLERRTKGCLEQAYSCPCSAPSVPTSRAYGALHLTDPSCGAPSQEYHLYHRRDSLRLHHNIRLPYLMCMFSKPNGLSDNLVAQ